MKPGEEMHSAVEEVDVDPCDLYLDLGALIVEGRIPGLTDRGFGEGPHCPPASCVIGAPQSRHHCNPETLECQKYEQMQKHMLLLWKNSIPMSIEVLLYPSCCNGLPNADTSSVPDMSYTMLEQWTVHMLPRRLPDATINPRGLMQAIRSFLYFSQLCAWYSLTGGKSPHNVHYRVCVPGEAFSSRFSSPPDCHVFPIANIGRNTAMKVTVKSHPRCGDIPIVPCPKHLTSSSFSSFSYKAIKQDVRIDNIQVKEEPLVGAEGEIIDGILLPDSQPPIRTNSPADSMLGESLLDPPNSLCMYPKRYQSPSRCGSPSLEVPEHLMFGKGVKAKRDSQRRLSSELQSRSRPIHRSVFQQVVEKNFSDGLLTSDSSSSPTSSYKTSVDLRKSETQQTLEKEKCVGTDLRNYFCYSSDLKDVPKAEMESVLHRLRNSQCSRTSQDKLQSSYPVNDYHKYNLYSKEVMDQPDTKFNKSKLPYNFNKSGYVLDGLKPSFQHIQKSLLNYKPDFSSKIVKMSDSYNKSKHSKKNSDKLQHEDYELYNFDYTSQKPMQFCNRAENVNRFIDTFASNINMLPSLNKDSGAKPSTYQSDFHKQPVPANFAGVNIKKCGALIESLTLKEKIIDERKIMNGNVHVSLLQKHLKSRVPEPLFSDDPDNCNHMVPSAEEKAQFRRSLDSATSLVFHQKSGLPLTSSPAPIRKSGTCFDFDSSLTTVSAIKRALFEENGNEEEEEQNGESKIIRSLHSSTSAPSSMTVSSLLGTFEESVLNGRLEPVSTVEGFTAEIGASGSFCPRHITLPVTIFFYTLQDIDKVTSPYLGHINLGKKDYHIPKTGTVQVTLFNPHHTVVKIFVVRYDFSDMPPNCQTFLRQRTLYMPLDATDNDIEAQKWLRYLIHLRFASSKSGRIYLHTDVRMIIFRKSDLDAATVHGQRPYELRSFTQGPLNPKFSPRKL